MANELQSLSQIFQNRLFRIPDYQRGYAWQQAQLVDFWDDLRNLQGDRYHYTGLLSIKELTAKEYSSWGEQDLWMKAKGYKPCHIVDGQQRLTTFIILVNEIVSFIRRLPQNAGKTDSEIVVGYEFLKDVVSKYICQKKPPNNLITTYLFGYETDNPSAQYLRYKVFCEPNSGTVLETYYTKNLKNAKNFFAENIEQLYKEEGEDGLNNFYQKLTQKLMFNIHEISDDYDVFVAFETMNNRGKRLTNLELLKNRLVYLTTLYDQTTLDDTDKQSLRKDINDAWKEVYYQLGRNKNTPLSDDEFLRAHWILYFSYSRKKGDDYIKFLLNYFSAKNIYQKQPVLAVEDDDALADHIDDEDEEASEEQTIDFVSKLTPNNISDYVNSLKNMAKHWYDSYFPRESTVLTASEQTWVDRLNRIGIANFRPLVTALISLGSRITADERIECLKAIERFIFVCFRMGNFNTSYCSSEYYNSARLILNGQESVTVLADSINTTVNNNIQYAVPNFITRIEKRFSAGEGYYSWKSLKYFMFEYEYSLYERNGITKISWELFTKSEKRKSVNRAYFAPDTFKVLLA